MFGERRIRVETRGAWRSDAFGIRDVRNGEVVGRRIDVCCRTELVGIVREPSGMRMLVLFLEHGCGFELFSKVTRKSRVFPATSALDLYQ